MEWLLVILVVAVAVWLITGPLRAGGDSGDDGPSGERAALEAAKEAKYREIRDAELDYKTGKLSREDWRRLDAGLRAEAVELLDRLEALDAGKQVDANTRS
jgi:hypothetical protein